MELQMLNDVSHSPRSRRETQMRANTPELDLVLDLAGDVVTAQPGTIEEWE
jgi:hypothetical protein